MDAATSIQPPYVGGQPPYGCAALGAEPVLPIDDGLPVALILRTRILRAPGLTASVTRRARALPASLYAPVASGTLPRQSRHVLTSNRERPRAVALGLAV